MCIRDRYGVVISIAVLIYNVQRLSPYLHFVELKNTTFVLTLPELMADPFNRFPTNIVNIPFYLLSEMAYVVGILGCFGFYFMYKKDRVITTYLLSWILAAAVLLAFVAKVLFPRYIMPVSYTHLDVYKRQLFYRDSSFPFVFSSIM